MWRVRHKLCGYPFIGHLENLCLGSARFMAANIMALLLMTSTECVQNSFLFLCPCLNNTRFTKLDSLFMSDLCKGPFLLCPRTTTFINANVSFIGHLLYRSQSPDITAYVVCCSRLPAKHS